MLKDSQSWHCEYQLRQLALSQYIVPIHDMCSQSVHPKGRVDEYSIYGSICFALYNIVQYICMQYICMQYICSMCMIDKSVQWNGRAAVQELGDGQNTPECIPSMQSLSQSVVITSCPPPFGTSGQELHTSTVLLSIYMRAGYNLSLHWLC